jgi:hypothetical protein
VGTDYFGFYEDGKDTVDVPNIRKLLRKGIRFQNATQSFQSLYFKMELISPI